MINQNLYTLDSNCYMVLFLRKLFLVLSFFIGINALAVIAIPKDSNSYFCAYYDKLNLIKSSCKYQEPRIIFIGGSNVAFGINSKMICDSLAINVINFGLHAGIGARIPINDVLPYVKKGDIVVLQLEYSNYCDGGYGNASSVLGLLFSTNNSNHSTLDLRQLIDYLSVPKVTVGNIIRLIKYPVTKSFNTIQSRSHFQYLRSGFNEFGDEICHNQYVLKSVRMKPAPKYDTIDKSFISFLVERRNQLELRGGKVILLPPAMVNSYYDSLFPMQVRDALLNNNLGYVVDPQYLLYHDSCMFDTGYHLNKYGTVQNSQRIVNVLRNVIKDNIEL